MHACPSPAVCCWLQGYPAVTAPTCNLPVRAGPLACLRFLWFPGALHRAEEAAALCSQRPHRAMSLNTRETPNYELSPFDETFMKQQLLQFHLGFFWVQWNLSAISQEMPKLQLFSAKELRVGKSNGTVVPPPTPHPAYPALPSLEIPQQPRSTGIPTPNPSSTAIPGLS